MDRVYVFMSTYNGEYFLSEQLDSILNQENVEVKLLVRDDGSSDNTWKILTDYSKKYGNITLYKGENIGYIKSFMWLVENTKPETGVYYAFSDQDDVWDKEKLFRAISMLRTKDSKKPLLYYSDLKVVDKNLKYIKNANSWEGTINKYKIAVFIGIRGCTMVYNNILQELLFGHNIESISGHDTYIALIAFWIGDVVYDENAWINYRQTGENLSITGVSGFDRLKKNLLYIYKRLNVRKCIHEKNAKEVMKQYGGEFSAELHELEEVAFYKTSIKRRLKLLFNNKYKDFSVAINLFNDFFIVAGKL